MHAVLAENWVVYTYWSAASHRFEASVLELYDDSPRSLGPVQLVFGANNATLSSYQPPAQLQVRLSSLYIAREHSLRYVSFLSLCAPSAYSP